MSEDYCSLVPLSVERTMSQYRRSVGDRVRGVNKRKRNNNRNIKQVSCIYAIVHSRRHPLHEAKHSKGEDGQTISRNRTKNLGASSSPTHFFKHHERLTITSIGIVKDTNPTLVQPMSEEDNFNRSVLIIEGRLFLSGWVVLAAIILILPADVSSCH